MTMDYKKIGKFISKLRKDSKMTQEKLAELLFVDRTTISKWELGQNNINTETLLKIAEIFNVTLNEMIIGEKINKTNINEINDVVVTMIRKSNRFKTCLIFSLIFILLLLVSFLSYYFVNNYNSIIVYEIHGESEDFSIHDGLMIISKEKAYITMGNIVNSSDNDIIYTKLYYIKDNEKIIFSENDGVVESYTSNYVDSLFQYADLKYVVSNLFLEIVYDDNNSLNLKLELKKSYSNNNFFSKNKNSIKQEDINDLDDNIPSFIKENYIFNEEDESYSYEKKEHEVLVKYTYFYESSVFIIEEVYNDHSLQFVYSYPDITYTKHSSNREEEFVYAIDQDKCLTNNCNDGIIDYFKNKYLIEINSMDD